MVTVSRLDNGNVLVHVDCVLKSGAVRQYFVTPDGSDEISIAPEAITSRSSRTSGLRPSNRTLMVWSW